MLKDYFSFSEIRSDINSGNITCKALTLHYLEKISKAGHLNAFLEVFSKSAIIQAEKIDEKIKNKTSGKLAGMVIGIKDNICYKGHKVSAASKILEGFSSLYNSTVVDRLIAEDAIIIGRLNCDEFAMGGSNENSAFGNVLNPLNNKKVPGGSSGGSAAAVAAGLCTAALGSDTGGSIRQPASFCGVVGLKPGYGRVSRHGLIAYGSSFDQIGPLTTTVEDAALILEVIAGADDFDSTVSSAPTENYSKLPAYSKKAKVAILKDCIESKGLNAEIKAGIETLCDSLAADGHSINYVDFPFMDFVVPSYYVLTTAEASSNLSRYDGIHYGYRSKNATDLESTYKKSRTEGFGKEVKRRIMLGTFVLSAGYYDAYYSKAQKVRQLLRDKTNEILRQNDFILMPTTPHTAFDIGQNANDPIAMYLEDIFTVQANLTGIPAISLPLFKHSNGMPYGIQLMSKHNEENELLAFSKKLEEQFSVN